jgi:hypothetical protein
LRGWVNRQAVEDGDRDGLIQSERDELKALYESADAFDYLP